MNNNQKKSSGYRKLLLAATFVIVGFFSLVGGYYFGIWQVTQRQLTFTLTDIIDNAPTYFSDKDIDVNLYWRVWQAIKTKYVEQPVDEKKLFYGSLEGMVNNIGDPYSIFLDPQATEAFNQELSGSFEGIGAEIGMRNNQVTIIAPLEDSPAEKAGLRSGDRILEIDGQDTADMSLDQAVSLIRGKKGTVVVLMVFTKESEDVLEVSVKRDVIKIASVEWELKDGHIAYIKIVHFNADTYNNFNKVVNEVLLNDPDGIILDLRNNPGGFLNSAIDIAGEFLEEELIVIEDLVDGQKEYRSTGTAKMKGLKTVVLVNSGSASASEIVAGALQDYGAATIIGQKTFGKGTVQDYQLFDDGSSLKLTVAKWLTPKGRLINEQGITPDIEVDMTLNDYNNDKDPQLEAALQIINE